MLIFTSIVFSDSLTLSVSHYSSMHDLSAVVGGLLIRDALSFLLYLASALLPLYVLIGCGGKKAPPPEPSQKKKIIQIGKPAADTEKTKEKTTEKNEAPNNTAKEIVGS